MFSDVLPSLASLSRAFQHKEVNFAIVKPLVEGTKATIDALLVTPGTHFQSLPAVLTRLAHDYGVEQPTESKIEQFKSNVHDQYLETLSTHITPIS